MNPTHRITPLIALSVAALACRDAVPALGTSPERAEDNATTMLEALADRFGTVELAPEIARTRPRLARYSTTPSRLLDDDEIWTGRSQNDRTLEVAGARQEGKYVLSHRAGAASPHTPGDARHTMRLQLLGEDVFRWTSADEVALGSITVADLDRALTAIFLAAERNDGEAILAATRAAFPRASASLARMFVIDSLRTTRDADDATSVVLGLGLRPAHAERYFKSLGPYAQKYWVPLRWRATLQDSLDVRWADVTKRDSSIVFRFRVKSGSLAPIGAKARRLDDVMRLTVDASAKVGPFRVGVRDLEARSLRVTGPNRIAIALRFFDEPEWQLPPLVARLLRSPLRRPFEGGGSLIRYGVRTEARAAGDTVSTVWRDMDVTVQESAILRFFGRLGGTALSDFRAGAEREAEQLWGESLRALAADVRDGHCGSRTAQAASAGCE